MFRFFGGTDADTANLTLAARIARRFSAHIDVLHAKADPRRCVPGLNCLSVCGLRDGIDSIGQFCIDTRLAYALKGDVKKGLFFRGSEPLPFGNEIRPVADLVNYLMTGSPTPP